MESTVLIIFQHFADAVKAHYVLKGAGFLTEEIVPPAELCECCELALKIDTEHRVPIEKILLENGLNEYKISAL